MPDHVITLMVAETPHGDQYLVEAPPLPQIRPGMMVAMGDLTATIRHCTQVVQDSVEDKMLRALGGLPKRATEIFIPMPMAK